MAVYKIGDLATWTYSGPRSHDKYPQVLILHDNWEGLVHGLNFNYLSDDEINFLRVVLNPDFREEYEDKLKKQNPSLGRELNNIEHIYDALNINSPHDFYIRFVKRFIKPRGWDPYRKYSLKYIVSPRVLKRRNYMVGTQGGAFGKYIKEIQYKRGGNPGILM
jgi:hypothetical protein